MNNRHRLAVLSTVITMFSYAGIYCGAEPLSSAAATRSPFDAHIESHVGKPTVFGDPYELPDPDASSASAADAEEEAILHEGGASEEELIPHVRIYDDEQSKALLIVLEEALCNRPMICILPNLIRILINKGADPLAYYAQRAYTKIIVDAETDELVTVQETAPGESTLHLLARNPFLTEDLYAEIIALLVQATDIETVRALFQHKNFYGPSTHGHFKQLLLESPYSIACRHNSKFIRGFDKVVPQKRKS
jgi:hypothetical protein